MEYQTLLTILLFIAIIYILAIRKYLKISWQVSGPVALPFLGNLWYFLSKGDGLEKSHLIFTNYGLRSRLWIFHKFIYFSNDPTDLKVILNSENMLDKASWFYYAGKPLIGDGLVRSKVDLWKKQRKLMNPAFSKTVLDDTIDQIYVKSDDLVKKLTKFGQEPKNIYYFMYNFALDSFCKNFFDFELGELGEKYKIGERLLKHNSLVFDRMLNPLYALNYVYSLSNNYRQLQECKKHINEFVLLVKNQKENEYQKFGLNPESRKRIFLERLCDPENNLSCTEINDNIITMILGGTESTSLILSFSALILGGYPEIQQKIHKEVVEVTGRNNPITLKDLANLKYVERFIYEIMRLFPPIPLIGREATQEIPLDDFTLPKGCEVIISLLNLHRNPKFWSDPLKFDPDRFLPEITSKRNPYTYIPFSMGPRNCIGLKYGMYVNKLAIANLVRNFEFKSNITAIEQIKLTAFLFINVNGGFVCSVKQRPL